MKTRKANEAFHNWSFVLNHFTMLTGRPLACKVAIISYEVLGMWTRWQNVKWERLFHGLACVLLTLRDVSDFRTVLWFLPLASHFYSAANSIIHLCSTLECLISSATLDWTVGIYQLKGALLQMKYSAYSIWAINSCVGSWMVYSKLCFSQMPKNR